MGNLKIIYRGEQVFRITDQIGVIKIIQQNGEKKEFLFNYREEDIELLSRYRWFVHQGYCCTKDVDRKDLYLTWLLYGRPPKGYFWHHMLEREDNRGENLRLVSASMNNYAKSVQKNRTTGIRGISYYKNRYTALIGIKGKRTSFKNLDDAIKARKKFEEYMEALIFNSPQPNDCRNYSLNSIINRKAA